jgi:O-antigen/teichoic acid export membrane protein
MALIQSFPIRFFLSKYNQLLHKKDYDGISEQLKSILKLITLITLGFILFSPEMGRILSSKNEFNDALILSPIIILGYYLLFIFDLYNVSLFQAKKNMIITFVILSVGILNIVLNKLFIPVYGYKIAAINTLVSFFVMFVLGKLSTHFMGIFSLKVKYFTFFLILASLATCFSSFMEYHGITFFVSIGIKTVIFGFMCIYIYKNIIQLLLERRN